MGTKRPTAVDTFILQKTRFNGLHDFQGCCTSKGGSTDELKRRKKRNETTWTNETNGSQRTIQGLAVPILQGCVVVLRTTYASFATSQARSVQDRNHFLLSCKLVLLISNNDPFTHHSRFYRDSLVGICYCCSTVIRDFPQAVDCVGTHPNKRGSCVPPRTAGGNDGRSEERNNAHGTVIQPPRINARAASTGR